MRKIGIILGLVCLGVLIFGGIYWYKQHTVQNLLEVTAEEKEDLALAKKLLEEKKPKEALAIIKKNRSAIEYSRSTANEWMKLFIEAATENVDISQLVILYDHSPKAFDDNEKASIIVGDALIVTGKGDEYHALRGRWKDKEQLPQSWLVLDADALLLENKRNEAIALLKSKQFEGSKDTGRLVRLALLYVLEQPKVAWDYLSEAYKKDPDSPDVRSYRAKLLESIGRPALALSEYRAAITAMPKNLFLRDQLAEFYVRSKQYAEALKIWTNSLDLPGSDPIWIKALFWNKVAILADFDWNKIPVQEGTLKPLIEYYLALKPAQFWDQEAFTKIEGNQRFLKSQQSTFWLRLIQALKNKNGKEASDLLNANLFASHSWSTDLEAALKQIQSYRESGNLTLDSISPMQIEGRKKPAAQEKQNVNQGKHRFFVELSDLSKSTTLEPTKSKIPDDIHKLLTGPFAYPVAFLAAAWYETAIDLMTEEVVPDDYSDWIVTGLIAAMREAKGNDAAIAFAQKQKQSPTVDLMIGELYISNKKLDDALKQLTPLIKSENDNNVASSAAFFIALIYMDREDFKAAKSFIVKNAPLFKDVTEKELLARIALVENDVPEATKLYASIKDQSSEAKSFLARKAFEDKEWTLARQYTEELLKTYPDNPVLRDNLEKVIQEQQKAKTEPAKVAEVKEEKSDKAEEKAKKPETKVEKNAEKPESKAEKNTITDESE